MATNVAASAEERDVPTRDGRILHLYEAGDLSGELVLIHHGSPGSGALAPWWVADAVARGIHLVGYDRPGYRTSTRHAGRSVADAAADAGAIADALRVTSFRTWGMSGGGPHALACAALLPDRVVAVATLASTAPFPADGLDWSAGMGKDNVDELAAAISGEETLRDFLSRTNLIMESIGPAGLAEAMRSLLPETDRAVLTDEVVEFMYRQWTVGQNGRYEGWLDDDLAFVQPWGFNLDSIAVPALVSHGRRDLSVPFAHGQWLVEHISRVTARLSDDGHLTLITDVSDVHAWLLAQA